ncbi:hypothetical protein GCM10022219_12250 [Microbacterium oryzae]|uniref:N-acetyltransferase domain-containing protein n=1 Tax=Microbacterium oryzae TaxID=743009 RepID=A0A6I6DTU6_9MICO|nr:GNAT family N-acetyltransferase [Microbacterium oryzae]QGU28415.1 hypothetical protein D7D94_12590 [Microbacterium oryzae]
MTSADDIRRAAAQWTWLPRGSEHAVDGSVMVRYPARFGGGVRVSAFAHPGPPEAAVDAVLAQTRAWGETRVTFWIGESDRPAGLEEELRRRGAVHDDTVTVFALPLDEASSLSGAAAPAAGVTVEAVRTRAQVQDMDAVNVPVWNQEPLHGDALDEELREVVAEWDAGRGFRVLARIDGRPVSTGGATIVDEFVRLWGAATVESARGRGAYRAVLAERLRLARELGATTALVKGRVATSAPILARAGFRSYGEERAWRLELS